MQDAAIFDYRAIMGMFALSDVRLLIQSRKIIPLPQGRGQGMG